MSVADRLISLGTKIDAAKAHCNESLVAMGTTEASTLWEVGDKILEINNDELIDYIEGGIINLEVPYGTTKINNSAFANNTELENVIIVPGVTTIGFNAFENCSSLTSITIPDGVTSTGSYAFMGCTSLNSIYITDIEGWCKISFAKPFGHPFSSSYDQISNIYLNGALLTNVTIPKNITEIKAMTFYGCNSLTSVTIPNHVTAIGDNAFYECRSLTSIEIPNSVKTIGGGAFSSSGLTSIVIPDSVTGTILTALSLCSNLTTITLYNVSAITPNAFKWCEKLTTLILPKSTLIPLHDYVTPFQYTPIESGTGYIYVPRELLSEYQTATNWSVYANQFRAIEDYPEICG
jgi:hypothetical protein